LATLTGALAHEIRNPLSTLKLNLQLLAEDFRDASVPEADLRRRSLSRLELLRNEADRLGHTLDDFMKFASPHDLALEPTNVNDLVQDLADFFAPQAETSRVMVRVALDPSVLHARIDRRLLSQALLNLMLNAQEAMTDGGELILRTRRSADGRHAVIEVADTGPGIPVDQIDKIFTAFYSTKRRGSGLGLATARRIVREHGGALHVHSESGRGSCFTAVLPLVAAEGNEA
jgi:signal transduction histidine kinase